MRRVLWRGSSSRLPRIMILAVAALLISPRVARAQGQNQKMADELFSEANRLVDAGRYAEACPKYEESNRLDSGIGTEFKLADCYEHTNRPATALLLFRAVERTAAAAGKTERQRAAAQRAESLQGKVPRVTLMAPPGVGIDEYIIKCDGAVLTGADLAAPIPLDPGRHELVFAAPGRLSRAATIELLPNETKSYPIPDLSAPAAAVVAVSSGRSTQRSVAIVAGSAGLAGLVLGTVAGALSAHEHASYTACHCASPSAIDESHTAYTEGTLSTVGFIAGGVGVAAAVVLWFTAPRPSATAPAKTGLTLLPEVGRRSASIGLRAAW